MLPVFWLEILKTAQQLNIFEVQPTLSELVMQQNIFYNIFMKDHNESALGDQVMLRVANKGVNVVRHLVHDDGTFVSANELNVDERSLMHIQQALPSTWLDILQRGITRLKPGEWALASRVLPATIVWRVNKDLGYDHGYLGDCFHVDKDSIIDTSSLRIENSIINTPDNLLRAQVVKINSSLLLLEGPLDRNEINAALVKVRQGTDHRSAAPVLNSTVHGTYEALVISKCPTIHENLTWSRELAPWKPPWPHIWRWIWAPHRDQKVSDFLYRLINRVLSLGCDRSRWQPEQQLPPV